MFNKTANVHNGGKKIIQDSVNFPPNSISCHLDVEVYAFEGSERSRLSTCSELGYPGQHSIAVCNISEVARKPLNLEGVPINLKINSSGSNHQPVIDIFLEIGQTGDINTPDSVVFTFICDKSLHRLNDRYHGEYHFNYSTTGQSINHYLYLINLSRHGQYS